MNAKKWFTVILPMILSINILFASNIASLAHLNDEQTFNMKLLPKGSDALNWTLKEVITDQMMTFSSFSGKIILIDFFLLTQENYMFLIPELKTVRASYSSSVLEILSINIHPYDLITDIQAIVDSQGLNWYYFRDLTGEVQNYYDVEFAPTLYFIDQNQKVQFSYVGLMDADYISEHIDIIWSSYHHTTTHPPAVTDFWQKNWYWFIIGGIFFIVVIGLVVQRQRIVQHNKRVREQKLEKRMKRVRKKER